MRKSSDNKWVKLALELDSMIRDWDRQMEELNSARSSLEMEDRDALQEQDEGERISERFALRLGMAVEKATGLCPLLESCKRLLRGYKSAMISELAEGDLEPNDIVAHAEEAIKQAESL